MILTANRRARGKNCPSAFSSTINRPNLQHCNSSALGDKACRMVNVFQHSGTTLQGEPAKDQWQESEIAFSEPRASND